MLWSQDRTIFLLSALYLSFVNSNVKLIPDNKEGSVMWIQLTRPRCTWLTRNTNKGYLCFHCLDDVINKAIVITDGKVNHRTANHFWAEKVATRADVLQVRFRKKLIWSALSLDSYRLVVPNQGVVSRCMSVAYTSIFKTLSTARMPTNYPLYMVRVSRTTDGWETLI